MKREDMVKGMTVKTGDGRFGKVLNINKTSVRVQENALDKKGRLYCFDQLEWAGQLEKRRAYKMACILFNDKYGCYGVDIEKVIKNDYCFDEMQHAMDVINSYEERVKEAAQVNFLYELYRCRG